MKIKNKIKNKITYVNKLDIIILLAIFVMFLVLIGGIIVVSNNSKDSKEGLIDDVMKYQAVTYKDIFESFIEEKVELLQGIARFSDITSMNRKQQGDLLKNNADKFGFLHFFVVDTKGIGVYFDEEVVRDQSSEPFFQNVSNNHVYITEPFYGRYEVFVTVCVSIFGTKNEKIGTLCGTVGLDNLQLVLAESTPLLDGELFMVNRDGVYLSAKDMQKVYDNDRIYDQEKSNYELINDVFETKQDKLDVITVDGKRYKAYVTYLEDYDWAIVQCIEMDRIFEDLKYIDVLKYGALVIVICLIGCVARISIHWKKSLRRINTDTLTGCRSRVAMEAIIDSAEKTTKQDVTLIYLDLNKFKFVNDTYGHKAGDQILCVYSKSLKKVFDEVGFVGRMGGDEFIVIMAGVNKDSALELCQKLEEILVEDSKELGFDYIISTSYGIATRYKGSSLTMEELMIEADEEMYKYKEAHR